MSGSRSGPTKLTMSKTSLVIPPLPTHERTSIAPLGANKRHWRASSGTRAKLVRRRDLASERRSRVQKQGPIARREGARSVDLPVVVKAAMSLMGAHRSGDSRQIGGPPSGKSRVVINPIQTRTADRLQAQRCRTPRLVALTSSVRGPWPTWPESTVRTGPEPNGTLPRASGLAGGAFLR